MKNIYAFLICTLSALPGKLDATTVIPFKHLGEATQASEAVVLATAESRFETPAGNMVFFDCRFRVQNTAKGSFQPNETFTLRQYSHRLADFTGDVAGDFVPEEGRTYLLFLHRAGDAWRPVTLTYFIFELKKMGDEEFLAPLKESYAIALAPRPDGTKAETPGVYRPVELMDAIGQYANGALRKWDASQALTAFSPRDFLEDRVLPTGCDFALGSNLSRWQNVEVEIYFDDTNAPGGFSGTLDNILGSMSSNYTGIDPINAGQTSFTPDCSDNSVLGGDFTAFVSGLNGNQTTLMFFDDPCNQIANLSGCSGTLAIGGSYSSSLTHSYKGDTWNNALWGFVVVNNGVLDCLDQTEYEIVLTHELTHTYRMDHLDPGNFPDQNMNPSCCNTINDKDIECMNYTYDLAAPVELTAFDVRPLEGRQVLLTWTTATEKDNAYFVVERSADGLHFETLKTVPGKNTRSISHYEWTDPLPFPGLNYYRLSQVDFDGRLNNLGVKAARMGEGDALFSIYPNPAGGASVTVLIDLPAPFNGALEIVGADGQLLHSEILSLESGRNRLEQSVDYLSKGLYWMRLRQPDDVRIVKFFRD